MQSSLQREYRISRYYFRSIRLHPFADQADLTVERLVRARCTTFTLADKCRRQKCLSASCQSKHAERERARQMGAVDLLNDCSDWSTVKYRPTIQRNISECRRCFLSSPIFVGDISLCRWQMSATLVGKCEQAITLYAAQPAYNYTHDTILICNVHNRGRLALRTECNLSQKLNNDRKKTVRYVKEPEKKSP